MHDPTMLTYSDLAARWNRDVRTIRRMVADKKIKINKATNMFSLMHIEAIEQADNDSETVKLFKLRALECENQQLRDENAMLKSTLFQISSMANEATSKVIREKIF